ncbi:GDP-L-fucose synthase [Magnetovibrio blakemorei]|uniref:GDP-L-fucose synthase n=1 Tax=Magnetovibrio blakemorei TaxID=28181 RepID=A0A1E5Q6M9_9PROT|nr:GDP-L-fucose synthase [Magnetovibrio blakemorei]OEJ66633.1 GDP-fucose synthetase [Magnetovibrio blakemorei]
MTDKLYSLNGKRVWVAGHRGMVGSALVRRLAAEDCEVITAGRAMVDLLRQEAVETWMASVRPDVVFLAAGKVGGIYANDSLPAEFIYNNLMIEANIIHSAHLCEVEKLLFLGSSCIYPKLAHQPMSEDVLLSGPLEPTNEWYAVAKIAGIKLCAAYRKQYGNDFISAMPTNLYGPGDNFDLLSSHVAAALLVKTHRAKLAGDSKIEIWGTGTPKREFLHVDDLADGLVFLMQYYSNASHINIGSGDEVTIRDLAQTIGDAVGYTGEYTYDATKPDGAPRKLMDSTRIHDLGWRAPTKLKEGMAHTYAWFLENADKSVLSLT